MHKSKDTTKEMTLDLTTYPNVKSFMSEYIKSKQGNKEKKKPQQIAGSILQTKRYHL